MKKTLAIALAAFLITGCAYYPYRTIPRERTKTVRTKAAPAAEEVPITNSAAATDAADSAAPPKPAQPAPIVRKKAEPAPDDLFFSFDLAPAGAKGIFTAAFGWQPGAGPVDLAFGMGFGMLGWGWADFDCEDASMDNLKTFTSGYARARLLLRNSKSTPFFYFSYIYNMGVPEEIYNLDTATATYSVGPSSFFGMGFGFLWRVDPRMNFTASIGFNKLLSGSRVMFESGDSPASAPELYEKLLDHVPDDTPELSVGLEFRF